MIKSFKCKKTEKFWNGEALRRKEINSFGDLDWQQAFTNLEVLNLSSELDLQQNISLKYHSLSDGRYSIDVKRNSTWRIIFKWIDEQKQDVELVRISDETH